MTIQDGDCRGFSFAFWVREGFMEVRVRVRISVRAHPEK